MTLIDGKAVAQKVREEVKQTVEAYKARYENDITLAVIQVGDNDASSRYVRNKEKACKEVGILPLTYKLDEDIDVEQLKRFIKHLDEYDSVNGILVQLPLPAQLAEHTEEILAMISPEKDVDGFSDINTGRVCKNKSDGYAPCTPAGIMRLLHEYNIDVDGKHCVVVGRSNIVGKPIAMMLLNANATVTMCHSKTKNINAYLEEADIIISAVGKPHFITKNNLIRPSAVIIDVGINTFDGKLCGDVDADVVCAYKTPVPGGVGPMTIAMLLVNTVSAANAQALHK